MNFLSKIAWSIIRTTLILFEKARGNPTSFRSETGPIAMFKWGHFEIATLQHADEAYPQEIESDIRVIEKTASVWEERTDHILKPEMIAGVFDAEVEVLVIGLGVCEAVKCSSEVIESIRARGIQQIICQRTPKACETYNNLIQQGKKAALLAHATC